MHIGILGGGVGGLSTAIALKQKGFDVDVYERHLTTTGIGAGIVCWPNASFVLDKLGVLEEVAGVSGVLTGMNRFSSEGEALGSLDIHRLSELMGYPSLSVVRKDLMTILTRRALELSVKIHYGHRVQALNTTADGLAEVEFDNGTRIRPEIIIGADGRMASVARRYVNGDNRPIFQGFINWIGVFESDYDLFRDISVSDYWGVGERFGIVPVTARKAYWAGGVAAEITGLKDPQVYKNELRVFTKWPQSIARIIDETPVSRINKIYVHDHDPISCWHKNNVLLIGDAAHSPLPTSGQGACQALEDAWHISDCLQQCGNIAEAFSGFTAIRQGKTSGITLGGRQLAASVFNSDPQYCVQRNLASKHADYDAMVSGMAKGWSSGLPLTPAR